MNRIKKVGILSLANIQGLFGLLIGLVAGLVYGLFFFLFASIGFEGSGFVAGLGLLAVIGFPVFYGTFMWISGVLMAFIYNVLAGWIGGVEIALAEV